jgi:hypothetical protein
MKRGFDLNPKSARSTFNKKAPKQKAIGAFFCHAQSQTKIAEIANLFCLDG